MNCLGMTHRSVLHRAVLPAHRRLGQRQSRYCGSQLTTRAVLSVGPSTPERRSQQIFYVNGQFVPLTFAPPAEEQDPLLGVKTKAMQVVRGYQQALERKPITTKVNQQIH
jgi:hypothetical protein